MKKIIKFFTLLLVLLFTLNIYAQDSDVQNDDRGLFSNDESTQEPEKEKKYRPYTFREFKDIFTIGQPIKYRRKGY